MKKMNKYFRILIIIAIVAIIIYILLSNKKQLDSDLRAMQEYNFIVPVEVITPKIKQSEKFLEENGIVHPEAEVAILSETSGQVIWVSGNTGEPVKEGQTLIKVENEVIESQYKLAGENLEKAKKDLDRYQNLIGGEAITRQQLEAAKLNYQNALTHFTSVKEQLKNTEIKSPVTGVIAKRLVEKGDYLMPSVQVFSIMELHKMNFEVKVTENDALKLNKGQNAEIKLDAFPGKILSGRISSIGVVPDLSGRYKVEIDLTEKDIPLRSGMSGRATFVNILADSGMVIPRKCIIGSINDAQIFVLRGDSVTLEKIVAVTENSNEVFVTGGISENNKIILSGQINLENGSKVRVINR